MSVPASDSQSQSSIAGKETDATNVLTSRQDGSLSDEGPDYVSPLSGRPGVPEQHYNKGPAKPYKPRPKPQVTGFCDVCNTQLNSATQSRAHFEGKVHAKKVRNAEEAARKLQPKEEAASNGAEQEPPSKKARTSSVPVSNLYCTACNLTFTSSVHAKDHYLGRNHARVLHGLAPYTQGYFNPTTSKWQRMPPDPRVSAQLLSSEPPADMEGKPAHQDKPKLRGNHCSITDVIAPPPLVKRQVKQVKQVKKQSKRNGFMLQTEKRLLPNKRLGEALATPLRENNKGFSMLQKMGYIPGTSLGLREDVNDLLEPIRLVVKADRGGLGLKRPQQPARARARRYHCEVCNCSSTCQQQIDSHLAGTRHAKMVRKQQEDRLATLRDANGDLHDESTGLSSSVVAAASAAAFCRTDKFSCGICKVSLNSEVQYKQHSESKKHLTKVTKGRDNTRAIQERVKAARTRPDAATIDVFDPSQD